MGRRNRLLQLLRQTIDPARWGRRFRLPFQWPQSTQTLTRISLAGIELRGHMIRPAMTRLILLLAALGLPGVAASDLQIERVIALGKLWADVRYFHSYLAYRDIEWDAALVKAIPKVKAAGSKEEYAAAIQSMLDTLEDP